MTTITREQILSQPDAPVGQRFCDAPVTQEDKQWFANFLKARTLLHDAVGELVPGYDRKPTRSNWWRGALEVCKATGLRPDQFDRLTQADEIRVVRIAAAMSKQQRDGIMAMVREAVKVDSPVRSRRPRKPETKVWLTITEASDLTGINKGTISRAARNGFIKARGERATRRVHRDRLFDWTQSRRARQRHRNEAKREFLPESDAEVERKCRDADLGN